MPAFQSALGCFALVILDEKVMVLRRTCSSIWVMDCWARSWNDMTASSDDALELVG